MYLIILVIFSVLFLGCSDEAEFEVDPYVLETESIGATREFNESGEIIYNSSSISKIQEGITESLKVEEIVLPPLEEIKDGLIFEWYENGIKKSETIFENGIKNGSFSRWYSNGELKERGLFVDDRLHGIYQKWNQEGLPTVQGYYLKGKQDGEWVLYDKSGNPMPSIYYKTGVEVTRELDRIRR